MGVGYKRLLIWAAGAVGFYLGARYLLPLTFPLIIGLLLAVLARPGTAFLQKRLHFPGALASAVSVGIVILLFLALVISLGAYMLRQAGTIAAFVPDLQQTLGAVASQARGLTDGLIQKAPEELQNLLTRVADSTFQSGQGIIDSAVRQIPGVLAELVSRISRGALTLGTGVLAGVMLTSRLPAIRKKLKGMLPPVWQERYLPALKTARSALVGWLKAQGKLMGITWVLVSLGLTVAGINRSILWAALVALVDAVPMLGTGTVLIPWGLFLLLQGNTFSGLVLLLTFAAALITRTVLEPRLVGRQIGLDPLITLAAFHIGFRLWGIPGMIFCPLLAAVGKTFWESFAVQK